MASIREAKEAQAKLAEMLADMMPDPVNGIGITARSQDYYVIVNLCRKLRDGENLPREIDGVRVDSKVVGKIRPLKASASG